MFSKSFTASFAAGLQSSLNFYPSVSHVCSWDFFFFGGGGLVVLVFYLGLSVVFKIVRALTCFLFEEFCFSLINSHRYMIDNPAFMVAVTRFRTLACWAYLNRLCWSLSTPSHLQSFGWLHTCVLGRHFLFHEAHSHCHAALPQVVFNSCNKLYSGNLLLFIIFANF